MRHVFILRRGSHQQAKRSRLRGKQLGLRREGVCQNRIDRVPGHGSILFKLCLPESRGIQGAREPATGLQIAGLKRFSPAASPAQNFLVLAQGTERDNQTLTRSDLCAVIELA